jgi:hypothetical protein
MSSTSGVALDVLGLHLPQLVAALPQWLSAWEKPLAERVARLYE